MKTSVQIAATAVVAIIIGFAIGYAYFVMMAPPTPPTRPYEGVTLTIPVINLPGSVIIREYIPDFEADTGIDVEWVFMPEVELRSKIRVDLSTGAGAYQLINTDIGYIAESAKNGWLVALEDYLTPEYDVNDFYPPFLDAFSYEGKLYGVPSGGETSQLMYRRDWFEADGIKVPTTMEELEAAAKHFTQPPDRYGIAVRGIRGEGLNVYIWAGFLRAFGGKFLENGKPVFNSPEAIEATEFYKKLVTEYAPPGTTTFDWAGVEDAFSAGKVAMIIDATDFATRLEAEGSPVRGKVGYAELPRGRAGRYPSFFAFGLAISKPGCKTEREREAAALFLQWATSKSMERTRALADDVFLSRRSALESDLFEQKFGQWNGWLDSFENGLAEALGDYRPVYVPEWPEMGDYLGIKLEEIFTGTVGVKAGLDDAVAHAESLFAG